MQHFSTWARWIATAILAAIGTITTDVVVDFIKRQPETDDAIHAGMKFLLYLAQQPWWPAPGSEDTELGVLMEPEVGHGETEVYARVQA